MKCKRPLAHRPEFEGKHHCKRCEALDNKPANK